MFVINDGFDNLELSVRLPPDSARLPVTVSFPEGKLIGLAKERLPVDISCCSSRPLSFTTAVDLMDEDGRAFSLMVTGATDNCSLSHGPFTQVWLASRNRGVGLILSGTKQKTALACELRALMLVRQCLCTCCLALCMLAADQEHRGHC